MRLMTFEKNGRLSLRNASYLRGAKGDSLFLCLAGLRLLLVVARSVLPPQIRPPQILRTPARRRGSPT